MNAYYMHRRKSLLESDRAGKPAWLASYQRVTCLEHNHQGRREEVAKFIWYLRDDTPMMNRTKSSDWGTDRCGFSGICWDSELKTKFGKNILTTFVHIYKDNGFVRGLYRGLSLNYIKAVLYWSVAFMVNEFLKGVLDRHWTQRVVEKKNRINFCDMIKSIMSANTL